MQIFDKRGRSMAASAERPSFMEPELRLLRDLARHPRPRRLWQGVRALGALSLLAVGAVHLQQYLTLYSAIPTIGTLFVLNFAGATAIGLGLLLPLEPMLGRWGGPVVAFLALGGAGLAATAFVSLLVSERTPLFGFMEPGYDPPAIMASRVAELAGVGLLGSLFVARLARRIRLGRW